MAEENGNQTSSTAPEMTVTLKIYNLKVDEAQAIYHQAVDLLKRELRADLPIEIFRKEA